MRRLDVVSRLQGRLCSAAGIFVLSVVALVPALLNLHWSLQQGEPGQFLSADGVGGPEGHDELQKLLVQLQQQSSEHNLILGKLHTLEAAVSKALERDEAILREVREVQQPLRARAATSPAGGQASPAAQAAPPQPPPGASSSPPSEDFRVDGKGVIGLVVVVDNMHIHKLFQQLFAMRCYAQRHSYDLRVFWPNPNCSHLSIFFKKHCTVAEFLAQQPAGYTALVLDGDVVPVVMERSLDEWLQGGEDLVFYEREWNPEVAAGNYIARNTPFTRSFLHAWANYERALPIDSVFRGADNGVIHVLLLTVLGLPCAGRALELFNALSHKGLNASDASRIPLEYKLFIAAAEFVRGPPRRWNNASVGALRGNITILPRMHAWVVDCHAAGFKGSRAAGSIFHHSVKTAQDAAIYFPSSLSAQAGPEQCIVRPGTLVDGPSYAGLIVKYLGLVRQHYGSWMLPSGRPVPFREAAQRCCMPRLSCRPLRAGEALPLAAGRSFGDPRASPLRPEACSAAEREAAEPAEPLLCT